jgi:hypothetical protein
VSAAAVSVPASDWSIIGAGEEVKGGCCGAEVPPSTTSRGGGGIFNLSSFNFFTSIVFVFITQQGASFIYSIHKADIRVLKNNALKRIPYLYPKP